MRNEAGSVAAKSRSAHTIATTPIPIFLSTSTSKTRCLRRPDRADLDGAAARARAARRPGERGVEIGDVDHVEAAELLLHLGVGSVDDVRPAVDHPHGGRR